MSMLSEVHSEPRQTSKMKFLGKIVNGLKPLTIFAKGSILDVDWVLNMTLLRKNCIIYLFWDSPTWCEKNILSFFLVEILENQGMSGLAQLSLIIHYLFQSIQFIGILSYSRTNQVKFMEDSF